tara:strand:- start:2912 stop:9004 length:6093 start_codon:yes stop_codon:yes gene_type:complete
MAKKQVVDDVLGAGAVPTTPYSADNILIGQGGTAPPVYDTNEVIPIDDPIQLFRAAFSTGVKNTEAQLLNFRGALASIRGDEKSAVGLTRQGALIQESAASELAGVESFGEFWEEPTFGGFINQVIIATGQFGPSAIASVGLAMTGAGVGAGAAALTGRTIGVEALKKGAKVAIPTSLAAKGVAKSEIQKVVDKKIRLEVAKAQGRKTRLKPLTADEEDMINQLYAKVRADRVGTGAKIGGLAGAGTQEQVMGTGISFGDYAEQGMHDPDSAFSSVLQGLGYTAVGLGSEVAVFKSVQRALSKKAPDFNVTASAMREGKEPPIRSRRSRIAEVAATTSISEGIAERVQEEISVQQKFRIDDEYTQAHAKLDRLNALFAGFFGGMGIGTVIGTPSAVMGKARDQLEAAQEFKADQRYQENKVKAQEQGRVFTEDSKSLTRQFADMANNRINRDMVWVDANSEAEFNKIKTRMQNKYPNLFTVAIAGVGTLYTTNQTKAQSFSNMMSASPLNTEKLNNWLADNLGYTRSREGDDSLVVEVRDKQGNFRWYQQTNTEGEQAAVEAAEAYIGKARNLRVQTQSIEEHIEERAKKANITLPTKAERMEEEMSDDATDEVEQQGSFMTQEEEVAGGEGMSIIEPTGDDDFIGVTPVPSTDQTRFQIEGSEQAPIVPIFERKGKKLYPKGWPTVEADTDNTFAGPASPESLEKAAAYHPELAIGLFNSNRSQFPQHLIDRYIQLVEEESGPGVAYAIDEVQDENGKVSFPIRKYTVPASSIPLTRELKKYINVAKRYARGKGSRFAIESGDMESKTPGEPVKPIPIDLPYLTNAGRVLGEATGQIDTRDRGRYGAALDGLGFFLSELALDGNYILYFDLKPMTLDLSALENSGAIVYTEAIFAERDGEKRKVGVNFFTIKQLQELAAKGESKGIEAKIEKVQQQIEEQEAKIQERELKTFPDFRDKKGNLVTHAGVVQKMKDKKERLENQLDGLRDQSFIDSTPEGRIESLEAQIEAIELKIEDRKNNPIDDFETAEGKLITQDTLLEDLEERWLELVQRREHELGKQMDHDAEGDMTAVLQRKEEDESVFRRRLWKNPYFPVKEKVKEKKASFSFSTKLETDLDAVVLDDFKRIATEKLGLTREYRVISTEEGLSSILSQEEMNAMPADILRTTELMRREVRSSPSTQGTNIKKENTGLDFDIIMVKTKNPSFGIELGTPEEDVMTPARQGAQLYFLAHEIGHSFVNQELDKSLKNPKLRKALITAFREEQQTNDTKQYNTPDQEKNFTEWMSDQVASYLVDETKKAQNQTESFFKRIAIKIKAFWKGFNEIASRRFKVSPTFRTYVNELSKLNKTRPNNYQVQAEVENEVEQVIKDVPLSSPRAAQKIQAATKKVVETGSIDHLNFLKKVFYDKDNLLRGFGPGGIGLAKMFRATSQSEEAIGALTEGPNISRSKMNQIYSILGITKLSQLVGEKEAILLEAENELISRENLQTSEAKEIRTWLTDFYNELGLKDMGIAFRKNFFPRLLSIAELTGDDSKRQRLEQMLVEKNKGKTFTNKQGKSFTIDERLAAHLVDSVIADPTKASIDITSEEEAFSIGLTKGRAETFEALSTKDLRSIGVLEEPYIALQQYVQNMVKKQQIEKRGGTKQIQEYLEQIKDPKQREAAEQAVNAMLGKIDPIRSSVFRNINNVGLLWNISTILTFSTFASFPDVAGPVLRSRELGNLRDTWRILTAAMSEGDLSKLSQEIGVETNDAIHQLYWGAGELDNVDATTKDLGNKFFWGIGLEWFTKFTRRFATGMGRRFLLNHAAKVKEGDELSMRYLRELNVTADEILAWNDQGNIGAPEHKNVQLALIQFVDESIVRPNSAERPTWADDPRFALVWQLKQFFYSYGKTVVGGNARETARRYEEAGMKGAAPHLFLAAVTLLPLTMLGFDLRERFKVGLAWALPGVSPEDKNYRRSLDMEWPEYSVEILDRSGIFGPFTLALPLFMADKRYGDPFWVGPLGPSVEKGYDIFTGDFRWKDHVPLYSPL